MENKQISNEILIAGIEIRTTFINGKHFKNRAQSAKSHFKNVEKILDRKISAHFPGIDLFEFQSIFK